MENQEYINNLHEQIKEFIKNKVDDENIEIKYSDFDTTIHDINIEYKIANESLCYCDRNAYPLKEATEAQASVIYKSAPSEETVKQNYINIVREHNAIWRKKWSEGEYTKLFVGMLENGYDGIKRETEAKTKDMLNVSKTLVPAFPQAGVVGCQVEGKEEKEANIEELFDTIKKEAESLRDNDNVVEEHLEFLKNKINAIETNVEEHSSFGDKVAIMYVCPACGGEKVVPCTVCTGDLETYCINCSGSGKVKIEEEHSDGSKSHFYTTCGVCHGTGVMNCPVCGGSDKRNFGSNGHLQCPTCDGEGGFTFFAKTQLQTTITPIIENVEDEGVAEKIEECKSEKIHTLSSLLIPEDDLTMDKQVVVDKDVEVKITRKIPDIKFTVTIVYNGEEMPYECRLIGNEVEQIDGISGMGADIMLKKLAKGVKDTVDAVKNSTKKALGWAKGLFGKKE